MAGTVFKNGSTLTTPASSTPGFKITANASAPAGQALFCTFDYLSAPIWFTGNSLNKVSSVFGDKFRAVNQGTGPASCGFDGRVGRSKPACMFFPQSRNVDGGPRIFSGNYDPNVSFPDNAIVGDIFLRTDTPSTANQRVYQCTTASSTGPGVWGARA